MFIYAATVILSAWLLFLVQPLITKQIFPWFGGASSVWIVALLFFQLCLLAGYAYAHLVGTKLAARAQSWVHIALLAIACCFMPVWLSDSWRPAPEDEPSLRILVLLTATIGLPCLALSATSPLLQAWYARERGTGIPLWLFAWSNAGSLAALLGFPLIFEPLLDTRTLAMGWSAGFIVFAALCGLVAWRARGSTKQVASTSQTENVDEAPRRAPSGTQMLLWVVLAAAASALLSASTVQLTVNIAPIPLLWVVPLAVYLLTFILCFSARRVYNRALFFPLFVAAIAALTWLYVNAETHQHIKYVIPGYLAALFVICMACHGEIVRQAPSARYLTRYYLLIALGGALGGVFVSVISPLVFETYLELPILLVLLAEIMVALQWRRRGPRLRVWIVRVAMIAGVVVLNLELISAEIRSRKQEVLVERNFYGVVRVRDHLENDQHRRTLLHGTIGHGFQFTDPLHRDLAIAYYSLDSGVGRVIAEKMAGGPLRVGVIGLGAGVLLTYGREMDEYVVYEINPAIVSIAERAFTYLGAARARGTGVEVVLGDARLSLEQQAPQQFDVLIVDAFSSDAIPVHLLTTEAFEQYARHLKPDGVLAVHVSNRYLDLRPVCELAARRFALTAKFSRDSGGAMTYPSEWVLMTADPEYWHREFFEGLHMEPLYAAPTFQTWTDRYSSLWSVMRRMW
jgi:SAM-dependent methyltransferase/heme/copper-type cytochrome/quinol oxidase subunit 4